MSVTANYSWVKPDVGGSNGTWGTSLNTDLDEIDADVFAVSTATTAAQSDADAAQVTADNAVDGELELTPVPVTLTGGDPYAGTIDCSAGVSFRITQSHGYASTNCDLTFTNRPVGYNRILYIHFIITVTGGGTSFVPKVASGQSQWAIPFNTSRSASGATTLTTVSGTAQMIAPIFIIGS